MNIDDGVERKAGVSAVLDVTRNSSVPPGQTSRMAPNSSSPPSANTWNPTEIGSNHSSGLPSVPHSAQKMIDAARLCCKTDCSRTHRALVARSRIEGDTPHPIAGTEDATIAGEPFEERPDENDEQDELGNRDCGRDARRERRGARAVCDHPGSESRS